MNDQAAAYVSAVDYFERMARTIVLNSQGSTKSTDMVTEPSPGTVEPSAIARASPSTSRALVATATQQPPRASPDITIEKRSTLQKPSAELRRPGRRIIRPQLGKREESPQGDVEMPEAEGAGDEGKQSSSHEADTQGTTVVPPGQTHVRKRQADSLSSELQQETRGETSSEIVPPASKKSKGLESQPDASPQGENLSKEPAVDESMDATTAADGDNEEIEAETAEEKTEESVEAQQENEAEAQDKADDEPVEENPTETETIPTEEESRDQTEQENQELGTDMESDKEEGEFDLDTLEDLDEATDVANMMRSPEKGEGQPETLGTPTQSPSRMETTLEEAETAIEQPLEDDKNDDVGDVAEEASDKPNNGNEQQAAETDIKPETAVATASSSSATPPTSSTPASAITSSETPETEETKRAASPSGGTIVKLADRAKENAAKRQAGVANLGGTRAPNPATRGRGRAINLRGGNRLIARGGRAPPRGGRGQSPSQP